MKHSKPSKPYKCPGSLISLLCPHHASHLRLHLLAARRSLAPPHEYVQWCHVLRQPRNIKSIQTYLRKVPTISCRTLSRTSFEALRKCDESTVCYAGEGFSDLWSLAKFIGRTLDRSDTCKVLAIWFVNYRGVDLTAQISNAMERLLGRNWIAQRSCDSRVGRNQFAYRGQRGSRDVIAYLKYCSVWEHCGSLSYCSVKNPVAVCVCVCGPYRALWRA